MQEQHIEKLTAFFAAWLIIGTYRVACRHLKLSRLKGHLFGSPLDAFCTLIIFSFLLVAWPVWDDEDIDKFVNGVCGEEE